MVSFESKRFVGNIGVDLKTILRGGSGTAATSKMEHFVIIVNGFQPLTIITKSSILDVAAVLDPPLILLPEPNQGGFSVRMVINPLKHYCGNNYNEVD